MPDILMTRIDNRLVHGQVGVAWTTALQGVNLIVVADDLAAADPLQQSLMTATAKSSGCGIRFFTLDKTIAVIHKASASQHIFLVVRNPQSARKLVEGGVGRRLANPKSPQEYLRNMGAIQAEKAAFSW